MTEAGLSPKMCNNVIQVMKMVVASAVNENGEEIHPRTWNHEFMDLPEVKNQRQPVSFQRNDDRNCSWLEGREQMLFRPSWCIRICDSVKHSGLRSINTSRTTVSTLLIRQKVWNGRVQPFLKTENGVRDIDLHPDVAAMLKRFVGNRTSGFLFSSKNGLPLLQSNVLRLSLHPLAQKIGSTEIGSTRISAVPHDVAEKTKRTRRSDSFLARPCKQECHGRIQQVEGGRGIPKESCGTGRDWLRASGRKTRSCTHLHPKRVVVNVRVMY